MSSGLGLGETWNIEENVVVVEATNGVETNVLSRVLFSWGSLRGFHESSCLYRLQFCVAQPQAYSITAPVGFILAVETKGSSVAKQHHHLAIPEAWEKMCNHCPYPLSIIIHLYPF